MDLMQPKYYCVKHDIIEKINNEEFLLGQVIPSERELMEIYKVSRITVRRAVEELVHEGYLYKSQGQGTFVKGEKYTQDLCLITSCTEQITRSGMTPRRILIEQALIRTDKKRQRLLEIKQGDDVLKLARVYLADDEPVNYTITYIAARYFRDIAQYDFQDRSLYEVLKKEYGLKITKAKRYVEAVLASDEVCEHLDMEENDPVLLFTCVTYGLVGGKEVPVETFKCFYRSDKFKFHIDQVGE